MEHGVFTAVTLIYVISFKRYGVYCVELSSDKGIPAFHAAVYVAVTVIVVHLKAEYTAVAAAVPLCKEIVAEQVGYSVAGALYAENAPAAYLVYREL